ncbi:hypothetical protein CC86DRAFT_157853 [Ophiobolus disseminans]|uniref:Uncharacterized protein n=1 Tax=Ophiobolus disseminans TaxID=1469910 RepID=A0A6A6ZCN2_9PLEO|nr:hypothetical protein CC86DRAFT_157853 [Ophiobolus disseminans]
MTRLPPMKTLPHIYVREFAGRDISYRIPIRQARNYWEFVEHVQITFSKPWEQYNAHLHFDNENCKGRVSASQWDAGGYFESEFLVNNELLLFAHFEKMDQKMPETTLKTEDGDEAWSWGWHDNDGPQDKWYNSKNLDDEEFGEWELDPYPPFPQALPVRTRVGSAVSTPSVDSNTSTFSGLIPSLSPTPEVVTVDECKSAQHLEGGIVIGTVKENHCRDPNIRPVVRAILNTKGAVCGYIDGKYAKRKVTKGHVQISMKDVDFYHEVAKLPHGEKRLMAIRHELQRKLAIKRQPSGASSLMPRGLLPTHTSSAAETPQLINDGTKTHQTVMPEGIIIGHARPQNCRDPQNPPVVRASISRIGAVVAYIPANDSLRPFAQGRAQLQMSHVVFSEEFAAFSFPERSKAIKEKILASMGTQALDEQQPEADAEIIGKQEADEQFLGVEEGIMVDIESS